jgi:hypothetical protein
MHGIASLSLEWARRSAVTGLSAAVIVAVWGTPIPAAAKHRGPTGACYRVSQDSQLACQNSAQDDYWIAVAKCDNAPSDSNAARAANDCRKSALDDEQAAFKDCRDQLSARNDVCTQLGGGPYAPEIDPADFTHSTTIDNPLNPFPPGKTYHYRTNTAAGVELDAVTVTNDTRTIDGIECVAVRDVVKLDGDLTEDTTDWYAQDDSGNVWYFGEDSRQFEGGVLTGNEGSWMAGVDGAFPGILMKANPAVGDVYRQEYAIGDAEDVAQVVATGQTVSVPYGSFNNALETREFSGLEPDANENKYYVSNVGDVLEVDLQTGDRTELVSITP